MIKAWVKDSGVDKRITFHSSRHTFATLSLTYGADLKTVSTLLGHTTVKNHRDLRENCLIQKNKRQQIPCLRSRLEFEGWLETIQGG